MSKPDNAEEFFSLIRQELEALGKLEQFSQVIDQDDDSALVDFLTEITEEAGSKAPHLANWLKVLLEEAEDEGFVPLTAGDYSIEVPEELLEQLNEEELSRLKGLVAKGDFDAVQEFIDACEEAWDAEEAQSMELFEQELAKAGKLDQFKALLEEGDDEKIHDFVSLFMQEKTQELEERMAKVGKLEEFHRLLDEGTDEELDAFVAQFEQDHPEA